jgi:isopentenyl-diphosphate Delta-isomerase
MDDAGEIFDVVDENDNVIGQATRGEVHARGLLHRAASIFVFNSAGQLLLQERSAGKDQFPFCWTSSASGHLDAGESYEVAAKRELYEELGLKEALEYLTTLPAGPETANEHSALFRVVTDARITIDPNEIASVEFVDLNIVSERIQKHPDQFTPPFRELFAWYLDHPKSDVETR